MKILFRNISAEKIIIMKLNDAEVACKSVPF